MSGENNIDSNSPVALDDDIETGSSCCTRTGKSEEARCGCCPYKDCFVITAQIISIVALIISSMGGLNYVPGVVAGVFLQVFWCYRPKRCVMIAAVAVSGVAAVASIVAAFWPNNGETKDAGFYLMRIWGCLIAALYLPVFGCLWYFVASGRHAKYEAGSES